MKLLPATLLALACALPVTGFAQWQWIDKDGRKVFSDRSPPSDIPAKNILKRPAGVAAPAPADPAAAAGTAPAQEAAAVAAKPPAAPVPKISGKDKELEDRKKQAEAAETEKKKAEDERVAKAKVENCARAKQAKSSFDSGGRLSRTNAKGEREILDDATRASETKRLQGIIDRDCAPA